MPPPAHLGASRGALADRLAVSAMLRAVPPALIDEVIDETGAAEQRVRQLPAQLTAYLTLGLWLWAGDSYPAVIVKLTDALAWAGHQGPGVRGPIPRESSIARARERLGPEPLRALFRRLSPPAGVLERWRGLPVRAVHTVRFGTLGSCHLGPVQVLALGDRRGALTSATWTPASLPADQQAARLLPPHEPPGLLLAGQLPAELWTALADAGAHIVGDPPHTPAHSMAQPARTITGPHGELATTHPDPAADAELAELHTSRAAGLSHTGGSIGRSTLRSTTGLGVDQELWALLCLYQAVLNPATAGTDAAGSAALDTDEALLLYTEKQWGIQQIAAHYGVYYTTIWRILEKADVPLRKKPPPECGTDTAYHRHLRLREKTDQPCKDAHAAKCGKHTARTSVSYSSALRALCELHKDTYIKYLAEEREKLRITEPSLPTQANYKKARGLARARVRNEFDEDFTTILREERTPKRGRRGARDE